MLHSVGDQRNRASTYLQGWRLWDTPGLHGILWCMSSRLSRKLSIPVKQKKIKEQILYSVGNMLFMDGYLVKKVALRSFDILVNPTPEELQMFQRPGGKDSVAVFNSSSFIKSARFMEGDTVMVVEGDHQSLVGYVERIDGDKVSIRATSGKKQEVVVLHKKQIVKFLRM